MVRKADASGNLVIPPSVRRRAGIKPGDRLEFEAELGVITIRKKKTSDDDEEDTPDQKRIIMERLQEGLEDVRAGRVYGPFDTVEDFERSLRSVGEASLREGKPPRPK